MISTIIESKYHSNSTFSDTDSYEGKKSALAASSISKECPYQHQGVLFHAEVNSFYPNSRSYFILLKPSFLRSHENIFQISKNFKKATSHASQQAYNNFKSNSYSHSHSHDDSDYPNVHVNNENYGAPYGKNSKSEYTGSNSNRVASGATYYYPPQSAPYMMPYSGSMMYQQMQYQTPYTSSYSPGGSNSDFTDSPALFYMKQQQQHQQYHSSYPSHMSHMNHHNQGSHSHSHMGSYTAGNSNHSVNHGNNHSNSNGNNSTLPDRSFAHTAADPSAVPSALQSPMSYNGKILYL